MRNHIQKLSLKLKDAMAEKLVKLEEVVEQQGVLLKILQDERKPLARNHRNENVEVAVWKSAIQRTCRETKAADPSLSSGMYWIDPDGQGIGDDPIYVYCDMTTGKCLF